MPAHYIDLPVAAATAYAQLQTATQAIELGRDVSHLHGSFSTKVVKGTGYWYFSFRESDQRVRQLYVGPDNDATRRLVEQARQHQPRQQLKPLAKAALSLGNTPTQRKHLSVISRLGEFGFFRAGGVLVGTHAFLCFANMLGVRWQTSEQTADIDFAHAGRNISIALPSDVQAEPHTALSTMAEGFLPMVQYRGAAGASYRHPREPEFQIDFLTPRTDNDETPIAIPQLDVALQPLRFMEFSLQDVHQAVLFDPTGRCVMANLPAPQRYAVHKLLVIGERSGAMRAKTSKDLLQAVALLEYFHDHDPDALREAWHDAWSRGPGWRKRAAEGRQAVHGLAPALARLLES